MKSAICNVTRSESLIIANNLNSGVECSSNEEKVMIRTAFFCFFHSYLHFSNTKHKSALSRNFPKT